MISSTTLLAGRYLIGPLIGQGGMSDVYQARDQRTGLAVAVKIVRSGDPEFARRLAQEVRALQRIEDPGLVRMIDTGLEDHQAYLVMELVDGPTLAGSLRDGPLGPAATAAIGAGLASALTHVHEQGIVHRDVKPSNILLGPDGRAKLGDFGIARLLDSSTFTIAGTTLGTAAYMAPEQLEDHEVGPSADIWSLGMVLLECLLGRRVYEGSTSEIIARRLAGPVPLPADLPVPWKLVLGGMLDIAPDQRLNGTQVTALLSTSAVSEPWDPSDSPTAATVPAVAVPAAVEAAAAATTAANPATVAIPATAAMAMPAAGDTRIAPPPGPPPTDEAAEEARRRRHWLLTVAGVAVLCAVLGLVLAHAFGSNAPAAGSLSSTTSTSASSTTTSTTVPPTTTTTAAPTAPTELAALVSDVVSGMDAGTINQGVGQNIETQAQNAVTDEASGKPQQAASDLQQAATAIADGEQQGAIPASEAATLQSALNALASTLGLSGAATATTTTTAPAGPIGPGGGPGGGGPGKGNGKGNGPG
jgi:eukaryotic-like serine/threonine-protein kinase